MTSYRIGFIGFGHLAKVLFESIDKAKILPRSHILFRQRDTHKMRENERRFGVTGASLATLLKQSDVILFCVRPQQAELALKEIHEAGGLKGKCLVSVLAGVSIAHFQKHLGSEAQVVRAMPNLCSSVGEGMTALSFSVSCSTEFRDFATRLFGAGGETQEVPEHLMDVVVGMSGSGPGFVFRLIEAMARMGEKHGMSYEVALKIAAQTFLGAGKLVAHGSKPADLLVQIAVPQGTTQVGLDLMTKLDLDKHFQKVMEAAAERSRELSNSFSKSH